MYDKIVLKKLTFFLDCRVDLKGYQGVIEIIQEEYANGDTCEWTIVAPEGNKINMTFTEFEIKKNIIREPLNLGYNVNSLYSPFYFTRRYPFSLPSRFR